MEILKTIKALQSIGDCKEIDDAVALIVHQGERIAELEEKNRWIPVAERLPEASGWYLIARNHHQLCVQYSAEHRMFNCADTFTAGEAMEMHLGCTHWMPLPEAPKEV